MNSHTDRLLRSMLGLPNWIKIWVAILAMTNMASLLFLDTPSGLWTAIAFAFVGAINMPMAFVQGGLTRMLSFPHLIWLPLLAYLGSRLFGPDALPQSGPEYLFALSVFIVNGISLMFDLLECYRWLNGQREVLGLEAH